MDYNFRKKIKILPTFMSIFIHTNTQDIVKHGVTFKHKKSLLTSYVAWKIFMKLYPKPFEIFFQKVVRLKKNNNELKNPFSNS